MKIIIFQVLTIYFVFLLAQVSAVDGEDKNQTNTTIAEVPVEEEVYYFDPVKQYDLYLKAKKQFLATQIGQTCSQDQTKTCNSKTEDKFETLFVKEMLQVRKGSPQFKTTQIKRGSTTFKTAQTQILAHLSSIIYHKKDEDAFLKSINVTCLVVRKNWRIYKNNKEKILYFVFKGINPQNYQSLIDDLPSLWTEKISRMQQFSEFLNGFMKDNEKYRAWTRVVTGHGFGGTLAEEFAITQSTVTHCESFNRDFPITDKEPISDKVISHHQLGNYISSGQFRGKTVSIIQSYEKDIIKAYSIDNIVEYFDDL